MAGVTESAERVASGVVSGLSGTPALMVILLLNMSFVGGAAWIWTTQENNRHEERKQAADLVARCFVQSLPMSPVEIVPKGKP